MPLLEVPDWLHCWHRCRHTYVTISSSMMGRSASTATEPAPAGSFLLCFRDGAVANQVLQAPRSPTSNIILSFGCFTHQARLLFLTLHYKVLISIENIPAHTWSISTAQKVLGSSVLIFDVVTLSASSIDLSQFLVMTRVKQPDLIPNEVG
jgi:hypothetical protein